MNSNVLFLQSLHKNLYKIRLFFSWLFHLSTKWIKLVKKNLSQTLACTFELCWMGFGHVQLRKLQSFRWLDDVPLLGATIQRATITTVFCASPPPSICCIRSFIHSKKEEKERSSFARVFFTTYGVFGFKGQHFCFN